MTGGEGRFYGERWDYINDWVCLGGYSGTISDNATGRTESDIYLYPAVDTSHGNVFAYGGKTPGRVQTGDCNSANKLDWKGNAASYGNCDNCYCYGFAWMYSPSGAGPKFLIGADDDQRTYVNGVLISSGTSCCNRDNFETGGISMPAGWSRILFKVRSGTGGFNGTVSLRAGNDRGWNEGSVTRYSRSYGLGYEQDDWYPRIDVASCYGASNPQPNSDAYGNDTTVTASGTASVTGPVPLWKVMHWEWGYGISEGNYADVSSGTASWSHTQTGVTGRRRFHFFSVSKSGRTSRQPSGSTGGTDTWADGGAGNYIDVYVDNVAPQNPSFSSAAAASTSQIDLGWAIPLDQGVGVAAGATEDRGAEEGGGDNRYRRGDVGVQVYRDSSATVYGWGTGASANDTGLSPNTSYTYTIAARDNTGEARGAWHNSTSATGSTVAWTLSVAPVAGSVTPDNAFPCVAGSPVTWTAVAGFGAGKVQKYKYAWNQNPTHTWTGSETDWASDSLQTTPTNGGAWYLHIKGYNGADVANGEYTYAVRVPAGTLKWIGGNGPWDTSTTGLWQDASPSAVTYCNGHDVLLDDSASGDLNTIGLQGAVSPTSLVNNSTKNYTLSGSGKISGSASLTKQGSSTLTVSTPNDYTGNTTVSAGTLALAGAGSIAGSPTNMVASGATFDVSAVTGGFHLASGQTLTGTGTNLGPVTVDSGATLAPGVGATLGTLTVSNNLTLAGTANLRIHKSGSILSSDQIAGIGTRANGGTLNVALAPGSDPLDDGDTFPLFSAASSTGAFGVTNLPSVGAGTNWWTPDDYGTLTLNVWPAAAGVSYARPQGMSLKIKIADVLTNVTGHTAGKTIRLGGVGASTNSATITTNSTFIFYNPATGNHNDENFSYAASDGRGGSPGANIHVSVIKWTGSAQAIEVTNNTVTLNFAGIPGYSYAIQRAADLEGSWSTLATTSAPPAGLFQWVDSLPNPLPTGAYYRLAQP